MTIPFLLNQPFEPETISAMAEAFSGVCLTLGLANRSDALTQLVAKRIINFAEMGVRSSTEMYTRTLHEFRQIAA